MSVVPRVSVIGTRISICDAHQALDILEQRLKDGGGGYVCFTSVHGTVMARTDHRFREILNNSLLSVADGKPVYWVGRAKGAALGHVPGPDFMPRALAHFAQRRHFFYGSTPAVLAALIESMQSRIPGLNVCGSLSPPFRTLTAQEIEANLALMRQSGAEFIWVGLGAPKQEIWMAEAWQALQPAVLMGVGAAFDFNAALLRRAPSAFRTLGLEWLYRLSQEPRRLWKRYLVIVTSFAYYLMRDAMTRRVPKQ